MWGGFNAQGGFALRLWTSTPKMNAEEWVEHVPALKRAASQAGAGHGLSCCICVFGSIIIFWSLSFRNVCELRCWLQEAEDVV